MKKIDFTYDSGIIIDKVDNQLLIITQGYNNPLNYDALFKNALINLKLSNFNIITIFIDMLSCMGNDNQRFCKINYNIDYNTFDFSSFCNVSENELPQKIKQKLNKFYLTNKMNIIQNVLISENQKFELLQAV